VTDLRRESLEKRKLTTDNPDCRAGKPCVYAGQTALRPEERFARHLAGRKGYAVRSS